MIYLCALRNHMLLFYNHYLDFKFMPQMDRTLTVYSREQAGTKIVV